MRSLPSTSKQALTRHLQPLSGAEVDVQQGESWDLRPVLRLVGGRCAVPQPSQQKRHFYSAARRGELTLAELFTCTEQQRRGSDEIHPAGPEEGIRPHAKRLCFPTLLRTFVSYAAANRRLLGERR